MLKYTTKTMRTVRCCLIEARKQRMWSQQELADLLGATQNTVSRWELGITTPSPYFLKKICTLFGKPPQDLSVLDDPNHWGTTPHTR
jgi:transcriptional regulator with XRE-family HTH domain